MSSAPRLGLRANLHQFLLLVVVNGFVGAMVGLERTVLPLLAEAEFGLASRSAALSFIATFGVVKAFTNLATGYLADRMGRRQLLVIGWLFAVPVPFLVIHAPDWSWIVAANVLLGIQQGLTWSTTVIMKIDLVGPKQRGLAMGLNEAAGYLFVALAALASGYIGEAYGLRPEPFYLGIGFATMGLGLSVLFARDTMGHVREEAVGRSASAGPPAPGGGSVFADVTWRDPALSSASQAGLVNNLNDGLAWGVFPLLFATAGLDVAQIGLLVFLYPATWGIAQLWTGAVSDRVGRKPLIAAGMLLQAAALATVGVTGSLFATASPFAAWAGASVALGIGTALVYPTLIAAITDVSAPERRGAAVGLYRFWRDSGYAVGALLAGAISDWVGLSAAVHAVAALTLLSGILVIVRMPETLPNQP